MTLKQCSKCGELKPAATQYFCKHRNGLRASCKACDKLYRDFNKEKIRLQKSQYYKENKERILARNHQWYEENTEKMADCRRKWRKANKKKILNAELVRKYGISLKEWDSLLDSQDGACAICGYKDRSNPKIFPVVDHCHKSDMVRSLLCNDCNLILGWAKDNPNLLRKAAKYVEDWNKKVNKHADIVSY